MKTTFLAPMLVWGVAMAAGCSDTKEPDNIIPPPDGTEFSQTFVQLYLAPNNIRLTELILTTEDSDVRCIQIAFDGEEYERESDLFKTLSAAYGDTSYNDFLVPYSNRVLAEPIEAVAVEWAATGTADARPLTRVTRIDTATPYDFIRNGYRWEEGTTLPEELPVMNAHTQYGYRPVFKPLDELAADDLTLIDYTQSYLIIPAGELTDAGTLSVALIIGSQTLTASLDLAAVLK